METREGGRNLRNLRLEETGTLLLHRLGPAGESIGQSRRRQEGSILMQDTSAASEPESSRRAAGAPIVRKLARGAFEPL